MPKYTVDSLRKKLQFLRKVRGSFVGSSMFVHTQAERGEAFSQTIHAITTQVFNSMNPLFKGVSFMKQKNAWRARIKDKHLGLFGPYKLSLLLPQNGF